MGDGLWIFSESGMSGFLMGVRDRSLQDEQYQKSVRCAIAKLAFPVHGVVVCTCEYRVAAEGGVMTLLSSSQLDLLQLIRDYSVVSYGGRLCWEYQDEQFGKDFTPLRASEVVDFQYLVSSGFVIPPRCLQPAELA